MLHGYRTPHAGEPTLHQDGREVGLGHIISEGAVAEYYRRITGRLKLGMPVAASRHALPKWFDFVVSSKTAVVLPPVPCTERRTARAGPGGAPVLTAWIIPGVLVGILWKTLLSSASSGIINHFVQSLGMERIPFLLDPLYAVISIIVANVWGGAAFCMILQYAGLQRIPAELYEVSRVDGARAWQQFFHITLPQLKPILFINLVLITISSFNTFDMIATLTSGGPAGTTEVLTLAAYIQVFTYWNMGRGAAIAVLLLAITVVMTIVYYKLF